MAIRAFHLVVRGVARGGGVAHGALDLAVRFVGE